MSNYLRVTIYGEGGEFITNEIDDGKIVDVINVLAMERYGVD